MVEGYHQISLDVDHLATSLQRELGTFHPLSKEYCIYKVPKRFRQSNEKNYTPQIVSVGPFHYGRRDLKAMENLKRRYLKNFLQRTKASLGDFLKVIRENETKIRNCYGEIIEYDSENFVKMILVDAAFIIEVFMRYHLFDQENSGDPIYDKPWLIVDVKHDICLLENQLPFFILQELFDLADLFSGANEKPSLVKLILEFCKYYWDFFGVQEDLNEREFFSAEHLVDFLRKYIIPPELEKEERPKTLTTPSVTALRRAGVKFKPRSPIKSLFDISFNNGVLEIPHLRIRPSMEILLKNLLAYERCHCYDFLINDYVILMSYLVDTANDVDLLVQNGIIEHRLRNNEAVSTLFRNFVKGSRLDLDDFYFTSLVENLNNYCKNPWHKWKANLKQDYFKTPWATASVTAAVILLILTFVQTVCSILQG